MDIKDIENKWQKKWEESKIFDFKESNDSKKDKKKYYVLDMFPYPSGEMHMGHLRNYSLGDLMARYARMKGHNVFFPFGFDSFGLPAENAAIKKGVNPKEWTLSNIEEIKKKIKKIGYSCSWKNEIATCLEDYYKWNQYIFIKFFEKGLAYKDNTPVNWCPSCKTVLANEQVIDGECERCDSKVEKKKLSQWYFKITDFANELYEDIDTLTGWPDAVKIMQKNWIGKKKGSKIKFEFDKPVGQDNSIEVFTTRPDTLLGVNFIALSAQSDFVEKLIEDFSQDKKKQILNDVNTIRDEISKDRFTEKEKKGVFLDRFVIHPLTGKKIPIYVANYVLAEYGTGFLMAVSAHDQRDFDFAKKYNIPIIPVIQPKDKQIDINNLKEAFTQKGTLINSGEFNGLTSQEAEEKIIEKLNSQGKGSFTTEFKLRDWCVSRQRYWGTPIPMIYCENCGIVPENFENLPVKLPEDVNFSHGDNPIKSSSYFNEVKCPKCGCVAKRETDTMDTFVDSSWYFLRYIDNKNSQEIFDNNKINNLVPIDQYTGGVEHAVLHLLYSRFFVRALKKVGILKTDMKEPFTKLLNQGMVLNQGAKMSKSKGNGVDPIQIINEFGADTARLFILSAAAPQSELEWNDKGVKSNYSLILEIYNTLTNFKEKDNIDFKNKFYTSKINSLILEIEELFQKYKFNILIVRVREFFESFKKDLKFINKSTFDYVAIRLIKILSPFVPHLCEEINEVLKFENNFLSLSSWPNVENDKIDLISEKSQIIFNNILEDIKKVKELAKIQNLNKIKIIKPNLSKYLLFEKLEELLTQNRDFKIIFSQIAKDEELKKEGQFLQKFLPKIISKGLNEFLNFDQESKFFQNITSLISQIFNCEVEIFAFEEIEENKKNQALPGKPSILVE